MNEILIRTRITKKPLRTEGRFVEDEFFNLVVEDENFADWVKNRLSSDNEVLEDKLSNLESLKTDVGVSYKNGKMKLFIGET